jgi:hypothetical protein
VSPRAASILRWSALALAGLVIAVGVGVVAAKLTSQQIGLSSEPVGAGEALAPKAGGGRGNDHRGHGNRGDDGSGPAKTTTSSTSTTTTTTTTPSTQATTTSGDEGGETPDSDD